ncbi:hypothetical protein HK105_200437 [Polyrhizophydium stewartii]|uniref:Uncharacterized protein n=1 Tax=Polyrhizophydium stewartii TaxID=2732419 RepID=A0ABR4NLF7_9FUNG
MGWQREHGFLVSDHPALVLLAQASARTKLNQAPIGDRARGNGETTVKAFGRLDVLVNNAGVFRGGLTDQLPLDDYHKLVGANIHGVYYTTRAAIPAIADGGAIINISSVVSKTAIPGFPNAAYSATKGFVDALTRGVAAELSPRKIRVNTVSPGPTSSDMINSLDQQTVDQLAQSTFFKRLGTPEDIAETVAFLAVPRSGAWFTGQNLVSAGGATFSL